MIKRKSHSSHNKTISKKVIVLQKHSKKSKVTSHKSPRKKFLHTQKSSKNPTNYLHKPFVKNKNSENKFHLKREIETRIYENGMKAIGSFDNKGYLVKGELQFPSGSKYIGKFEETHLVEGEIHFPDGEKWIGKFDGKYLVDGEKQFPDTSKEVGKFKDGNLREGEIYYPNGAKNNGLFDEKGYLICGEKQLPDGVKLIGEFKGRYLVEGEIHFPDGEKWIGQFVDNDLVEGTVHFPDGAKWAGKFANGSLISGTKYFNDGTKHIGLFNDSGDLKRGEVHLVDNSKLIGEFENGDYFKVIDKNDEIDGYYKIVNDSLVVVSYEEYLKNKGKDNIKKESAPTLIIEDKDLSDSDLNDDQKKAVLNNCKRLLVLAGAGSGKTKTLIRKIDYLINVKKVSPNNILAITFSKNAANEMIDRLIISLDKEKNYVKQMSNKKISALEKDKIRKEYIDKFPILSNITVKTFHSLCYNILKKHGSNLIDTKFKILVTDPTNTNYGFNPRTQAPEKAEEIMQKAIIELCEDQGFIKKLKKFILDYYVAELDVIKTKENNYSKSYITLKGDKVASKSERDIADWLYRHDINYIYEPKIAPGDFEFQPDFFITDANLYIEHVSNLSYSLKDKEKVMKASGLKYERIEEKDMQSSYNFNKKMDAIVTRYLDNNLKNINPLVFSEEFKGIQEQLNQFILDLISVIAKIKIQNRKVNDIYKKSQEDNSLRVRTFYQLAKPIIQAYGDYCVEHSYLDFDDLMKEAVDLLKKNDGVREKYQEQYKYILVDEFQDVNSLQIELLNSFLTPENQLFCVGDDWQSIYRWRGSEVEYIVNFKEYFNYPECEIIKLKINYRSNDTIVNASNEVIKNNKNKLFKDICAFNRSTKKITLYCSNKEKEDGVFTLINRVKELLNNGHTKEDIMILSRTRKSGVYKEYNSRLRQIGMKIQTMHQVKGLEAKSVFIIGLTSGYPYIREIDRIFQIIKESNYEHLIEEERRLFYVALTRAKEELFLMSESCNESEFLGEIPNKYITRQFCKEYSAEEDYTLDDDFEE